MLDIEPVVFKVIRHVRPKFSCRACEKIVQAPAPDKAIVRGKASFRMIGHIIVSKFDHHLPLYRQAEMMAAQGVDPSRTPRRKLDRDDQKTPHRRARKIPRAMSMLSVAAPTTCNPIAFMTQ